MGLLDGKVALITGAARGQGAAEGRLFVEAGARVLLGDVLDADGEALASELGDAARYRHLDVTSETDWSAAVEDATTAFGRLDILINNAGIFRLAPLEAVTLEEYRTVIEINQVGVFLGMRAVVSAMRSAGGGSIVNISSIDGLVGSANSLAYVASKFAVRGMTKVAAIELGPAGIRVNSIHPGGIQTPMVSEAIGDEVAAQIFKSVPLGRIGKPEEVARMAMWLASDEASYSTGSEFVIDGGWTAGFVLGEE